jgi:hypothetical protein
VDKIDEKIVIFWLRENGVRNILKKAKEETLMFWIVYRRRPRCSKKGGKRTMMFYTDRVEKWRRML